jgi:hypothetical protein
MLISIEDDPELEATVEAIAAAALASPAYRRDLAVLAEMAERLLLDMRVMGLLRIERAADGSIAAELLRRVCH